MTSRTLNFVLALLAQGLLGQTLPVEPVVKALDRAIKDGETPGAVYWIEREGKAAHGALGNRSFVPAREVMTDDTIFDAASLTKVVATTTSVLILVDEKKVRLDAPVRAYLPEFRGQGREFITVKHLLTHVSGLRP